MYRFFNSDSFQLKSIIKKIAYPLGSFLDTGWLNRIAKQPYIVPLYHLVSDVSVSHIRHLYRIKSIKEFVEDLDFFLKNYEPISYIDFQSNNCEKAKKPWVLLTFDDGLSQFNDIVAPILLKKGIPAICFLNSGFVDNGSLFYRYKASLLIDKIAHKTTIEIDELLKLFKPHSSISHALLSVSYKNKHILDIVAEKCEVSFEQYLKAEKPYMTTQQIDDLIKQGFYFGSHSIDHPEYRFIDLEEQIRQTDVSTQSIGNKFKLSHKAFAFPFSDQGVSGDFFQTVYSKKIIESAFGTAGLKKQHNNNCIQRISCEIGYLTAREIINTQLLLKAFL